MNATTAADIIAGWPEESREAARLVLDARGEPDEMTDSLLVWHEAEPWKRLVASRQFYEHSFPAPHIDCVESIIDYRVPVAMYTALAEFDGSVVAERTAGEISARCHDEQANYLALNLADEIVNRKRSVEDARAYYAKEFLDARRGQPTPYMEGLRFQASEGADPDRRILSDADLESAVREGKKAG
ncbi:MAG TPA: hypothetical protein VJ938_12985 [Acidimicrobiia bacterium]|nr:hypothetical protein [Acidimicrobiia bacterium]